MAKKKAKKRASVRNTFTPEVKATALRLISEGHTRKEVAAQIGCSTAALQLWKVEAKSGKIKVAAKDEATEPAAKPVKKAKKMRRRRRRGLAKTTVATAPAVKPSIAFDKFVQDYWSEYPAATDIMRLSPDIMPKAVQYVNDVLKYAYDHLCGE